MPAERRVLELHEVSLLLKHCKTDTERAVLLLMYDCALRAGEVSMQRCEHLDRAKGQLRVIREKNGVEHYLGIAKETVAALDRSVISHGVGFFLSHWHQQKVRDWYRALAARAGLTADKRYSHILRRSRASHLLDAGATVAEVQRRLGHKSPATTMIYLGLSEGQKVKSDALAEKTMLEIARGIK